MKQYTNIIVKEWECRLCDYDINVQYNYCSA